MAQIHGATLSGLLAWLAWLLVHLYFLMGLQNRFIVFVRWTVSFITRGRGARLITGPTLGADTSQADAPAAVPGCRYLEDSAALAGMTCRGQEAPGGAEAGQQRVAPRAWS